MCAPSSALKQINQSIQAFSNKVTDEAGTIFGDANSVFNDIKTAMSGIVSGGPSQTGWGQAEKNARDAAAVQLGATEARNLKSVASSATGAIGGGNTVNPAGSTQQVVMGAEQKAAADTASQLNQNLTEDYEQGNQNFFKAAAAEEQAPSVFSTSNSANEVAQAGQKQAQTSQQSIDTQNNWWQPLVEKATVGALGSFTSAFTGGLGSNLAKNLTNPSSPGNSSFLPSDQGGWGDQGSSTGS
jgi:hypothetical protein